MTSRWAGKVTFDRLQVDKFYCLQRKEKRVVQVARAARVGECLRQEALRQVKVVERVLYSQCQMGFGE